jgi:hypothetical protein
MLLRFGLSPKLQFTAILLYCFDVAHSVRAEAKSQTSRRCHLTLGCCLLGFVAQIRLVSSSCISLVGCLVRAGIKGIYTWKGMITLPKSLRL